MLLLTGLNEIIFLEETMACLLLFYLQSKNAVFAYATIGAIKMANDDGIVPINSCEIIYSRASI